MPRENITLSYIKEGNKRAVPKCRLNISRNLFILYNI